MPASATAAQAVFYYHHILYFQKTNDLRMASDQLTYTDDTIAQIAEHCGYNNLEHFCRQFKKITGKTPLTYRREIRKKQ